MLAPAFRRCLLELDVDGMIALDKAANPHLPPPGDRQAVLVQMHIARTAARSIPQRQRFYSHRWLLDHGYPSQLPDPLRPSAERMYPRIADSVGIAVSSSFPEVVTAIRGAMSVAVEDCYANGDRDPAIVKPRMMEARARERRGLGLSRIPQ